MRLKLRDSAEGPGGGTGGPPVTELAVLSGPHEVLPAVVVGVLVQGPVAVHDVAGVDVAAAEMILHRLAVLTELHHLTLEVGPLIDAHAIGALTGLETHSEVKGGQGVSFYSSLWLAVVLLYYSSFLCNTI